MKERHWNFCGTFREIEKFGFGESQMEASSFVKLFLRIIIQSYGDMKLYLIAKRV